jgi:hypothetical protein
MKSISSQSLQSQSQSQSSFTTGGLLPIIGAKPLKAQTRDFFQLNTCGYSPYVTSSLTRGWVCRLQLLLVWPAQSVWGQSPAGLMTVFYSLRFETPPTWRARSPFYILQEQGDPVIPPGTGFPFRRLLRLAGLGWRYSNPPPYGVISHSLQM